MEIDSLHKKKTKILEEETQATFMAAIATTIESDLAESAPASVSHFKIPPFLLKTFRKGPFDHCNDHYVEGKRNSSEIEIKKNWIRAPEKLFEVASVICKIFGGAKLSACGIGSKVVDGEDEDDEEDRGDYCLSESEGGEDYRVEKILAAESDDESGTEKKIGRDEKISSQSRHPTSILEVFSKKNAVNFSFSFNLGFNFIKSRICKGKNGDRNSNLNYDQHLREIESAARLTVFGIRENPKRLLQIPSRERKLTTENSYHEDDENGEELWQKRILMGEKCKPLNTSVSLRFNQNGMTSP